MPQFNPTLCPPVEIPASTNVTDLTELTFWGRIADGRVWMVEFYAGGYCLCTISLATADACMFP
jgi:hypothetical protein